MAPLQTSISASSLRSRLHGLSLRGAQLQGRREAEEQQQAQLLRDVSEAKGRMTLSAEVGSVFEGLQTLAHQRSVGSLESLLTAIVNDVLPDEGAIRMIPSYKANSTHLDVLLDKEGNLEDVLDANGGAITNVVCAGLRFAALAQTSNRRLVVLDEPDCWLKPDRVSAFANTIAQVAHQGRFQAFFITHHHPSYFEGLFNIVQFGLDAKGAVMATALSPQVGQWADDDEPGIRKIELFNVRRHEHTVVPCFPGATAYIGNNNLGKSTALISALKVVAYGESDDTIIRHGCEEARIVLHLEGNQRIEWSRNAKRSPTVLYRLFKGDEMVTEGRQKARNQAPEWVTDVLGVSRVDDLDIQVGNQKSPVFLLNDSAPRRAQILSVGRESSYLPALMREYEAVKAADRELIKHGESTLSRLRLRATYLERVPRVAAQLAELATASETVLKALERREVLDSLIQRMAQRAGVVERLQRVEAALEPLPSAPPVLKEANKLADVVARLGKYSRVEGVAPAPAVPEIPALKDLSQLRTIGVRIARGQKLVALSQGLPRGLPELPPAQDGAALLGCMELLSRRLSAAQAAERTVAAATRALADAEDELNRLVDELGGQCPLCGGALAHEHPHTELESFHAQH